MQCASYPKSGYQPRDKTGYWPSPSGPGFASGEMISPSQVDRFCMARSILGTLSGVSLSVRFPATFVYLNFSMGANADALVPPNIEVCGAPRARYMTVQ